VIDDKRIQIFDEIDEKTENTTRLSMEVEKLYSNRYTEEN